VNVAASAIEISSHGTHQPNGATATPERPPGHHVPTELEIKSGIYPHERRTVKHLVSAISQRTRPKDEADGIEPWYKTEGTTLSTKRLAERTTH